ncbi:MAG: GIY-YIG nuclease family protein [Sedimentisphaerales bacterium]|nr:GIY-YIG nuclease family protein [Sedimentisphaerales bacterium]
MFWVYILINPHSKYYIGHTDNLERRLSEHNSPECGSGKFTHKNGPWKLIWSEKHNTRSEAMVRERFIKSKKSALWIQSHLINR